MPTDADVSIIIYNVQGSEVETLTNYYYTSGYHSINWDASRFPSGIYFVKMIAGNFTSSQKLILVK